MTVEPDFTVRLVAEDPDSTVQVVGDQVITATPADDGRVLVVDEDGVFQLVDPLWPTSTEFDAAVAAAAPVRVTKADANLVLGIVANTWHDVDANGSAAARPLDVVIPNVEAGQWVEVAANLYSPNAATAVYLDVFTVVAGAPVHQFGSATTGTVGWLLPSGLAWQASNSARYQVQADDIENGSVRLRLRDRNTTTTARSIGSNSGIEFEMAGTGPFG